MSVSRQGQLALAASLWIGGTVGLAAAYYYRTPWLTSVRTPVLVALIVLASCVLTIAAIMRWRCGRSHPAVNAGLAVVAATLALTLATELSFRRTRAAVLSAPSDELARAGRHVIAGYRNLEEVHRLIDRGAIGGVFVTASNVRGKTAEQVKSEIAEFQRRRAATGQPRLWIATDQEGGPVARLSPPLMRHPAPRVVFDKSGAEDRLADVVRYAAAKGRELAQLGVNLNFAPVVDLDFGVLDPTDRLSRISERAIGRDARVVADVAHAYCGGLASVGVACTLKHFPGLGRVAGDTHVGSAALLASRSILEAEDWVPFRAMPPNAAVMVGHAAVPALDGEAPASTSKRIVGEILRSALGHVGLVITDDMCMWAVSGSRRGIAGSALAAMAAGADLLLVSYDSDQVYPVLAALMAANRDGSLPEPATVASVARLNRFVPVR